MISKTRSRKVGRMTRKIKRLKKRKRKEYKNLRKITRKKKETATATNDKTRHEQFEPSYQDT